MHTSKGTNQTSSHVMGKSLNTNHQVSVVKQGVSVRHFGSFEQVVQAKDCMLNDFVFVAKEVSDISRLR